MIPDRPDRPIRAAAPSPLARLLMVGYCAFVLAGLATLILLLLPAATIDVLIADGTRSRL